MLNNDDTGLGPVPFIPIFEITTSRVKGISFHPTRSWILLALHDGSIQLWDYNLKMMVTKFDEHKGPVRSVAFHPTQPLFVSGGDDKRIKLWNYLDRVCLFTFTDHQDYIRSVEFHHEYPWILSCSDDQTIRIWNWQSRKAILVLGGHSNYVMCARFHPVEDLFISASLDSTLRLWDLSAFCKKNILPISNANNLQLHFDILGTSDVNVKFILESQDGINCVDFHPHHPFIVSASDDRQVKIWRWSDTKAWEVDTFSGHYNNVSSAVFHPTQDIIISCSEDRTMRFWDIKNRTLIYTYHRQNDRFWTVKSHPHRNLLAAGHDSGLVIFKTRKERPMMAVELNKSVFYVKGNYLMRYLFETQREMIQFSLKSSLSRSGYLTFNQDRNAFIIFNNTNQYELYLIQMGQQKKETKYFGGLGKSPVWIEPNVFVTINPKTKQLVLHSLNNKTLSTIPLPQASNITCYQAHPMQQGCVLMKNEKQLSLFHVFQNKTIASMSIANPTKFCIWSQSPTPTSSNALLAVIGRNTVVIASETLELLQTVEESSKIKSAIWSDQKNMLIYTTSTHIRYLFSNGDHGIVKALIEPIYLMAMMQDNIIYFDRQLRIQEMMVDAADMNFKLYLMNHQYRDAFDLLKRSPVAVKCLQGYLQEKGFPEVALHFSKDDRLRFHLAMSCGQLDIAYEAALNLDQIDIWLTLMNKAVIYGQFNVVEKIAKHCQDVEKLSFLYLITGQLVPLKNMQRQFEVTESSYPSAFQITLWLGDIPTRIALLEKMGQIPLAYLTAKTHNMNEEALRLKSLHQSSMPQSLLEEKVLPLSHPSLLIPPLPLFTNDDMNWPTLVYESGIFDQFLNNATQQTYFDALMVETRPTLDPQDNETTHDVSHSDWADGDALFHDLDVPDKVIEPVDDIISGRSGSDDVWDLELDLDLDPSTSISSPSGLDVSSIPFPEYGNDVSSSWIESSIPSHHVAAGSFKTAIQLLHDQIGLIHCQPLQSYFLNIATSSYIQLTTFPFLYPLETPLIEYVGSKSNPQISHHLQSCVDGLQLGYKDFTAGRFQDAILSFRSILHRIPLLSLDRSDDFKQVQELIAISGDYLIGLMMELARKKLANENGSISVISNLAFLFTRCKLQLPHHLLTLRSAMNSAMKYKNLAQAKKFATRIIQLHPKVDVLQVAQRVIDICHQKEEQDKGLVDLTPIEFNERNPSVICAASFKPIYQGTKKVNCPYCHANYDIKYSGMLCHICQLSEIGSNATGLNIMNKLESD